MTLERKLTFALSADYARGTGGYIYDERLLAGLMQHGWRIERLTLPAGFPFPSAEVRREAARLIATLPDRALLLTDQLCLDVMPEVAAANGDRLRLAVIVHHPLADEGYGPSETSAALRRGERAALAHVAVAIVTSPATARRLAADYDVEPGRIVIAPPGTDPLPLSAGSPAPPLRLLGVGAVVPRKGHDLLIEALAPLRGLSWQLTLAGDLTRAPAHVARIRELAAAAGLAERVTLAGELLGDAIEPYWRGADVFVSASRHEGYGMAVAEAVARGLPVVATEAGTIGDWLGAEAAEIVPTGDRAGLTAALVRVVGDAANRRRLREAAIAFRPRLPDWRGTAATVAASLERLER